MFRVFSKPLRISSNQQILYKTIIHLVSAGYLAVMFYFAVTDNLGADPVESLLHFTGTGAVNLLLLTLLVSPAAKLLPCGALINFRRLVGLYAFFYALTHFVTYILFELQLNFSLLGEEIVKRPYITVGFVALLLLISMAATSTRSIQRKMGKKWQSLHNSIYLAAILAILHFTWAQKTLGAEPLVYWGLLFILLLPRFSRVKRAIGR